MASSVTPRIDLFYYHAGGGHRTAATALEQVLAKREPLWRLRVINFQHLQAPLDVFRKITGIPTDEIYNRLLMRGWTRGIGQILPWFHALIRWRTPALVRLLEGFWRQDCPDVVVSVIPHFNQVIFKAFQKVNPAAPFITIVTDLADYPPNFWMHCQPQYFICGTERGVQQALAMGHPAERAFRTSGMILSPSFYEPLPEDRPAERARLGLQPDRPTGVLLFGGTGSSRMVDIARRLNRGVPGVQLILLCGRNRRVAEQLRKLRLTIPAHVVEFTTRVPYYLHLADFFIGKPGPGSLSEAVAMRLPVVLERNAWTMPQERFNTDWVVENDFGVVVRSFSEVAEAVAQILEPQNFHRHRAALAKHRNRALFEIPEILRTIFEREFQAKGSSGQACLG